MQNATFLQRKICLLGLQLIVILQKDKRIMNDVGRKILIVLLGVTFWVLAIATVMFYTKNPFELNGGDTNFGAWGMLLYTTAKVQNYILDSSGKGRIRFVYFWLRIEKCPPFYKYMEISGDAAITLSLIYAFVRYGLIANPSHLNICIAIGLAIFFIAILLTLVGMKHYGRNPFLPEQLESFQPMIGDFKKSDAYKEVLSVVEQIGDDFTATEIESLKSDMRKQMLSICTFLKENAPSLNKDDIDYCLFALLGLKQVEILKFFNVSYSTLRSRKNRIKEKMNEELYKIIFQE